MLPIQNPGLDLRDLVVEQVPISSLKPYPTNPRTHSRKQIRQIAESIRTFGWTNPVLVDADGRIIAGHGRAGRPRSYSALLRFRSFGSMT